MICFAGPSSGAAFLSAFTAPIWKVAPFTGTILNFSGVPGCGTDRGDEDGEVAIVVDDDGGRSKCGDRKGKAAENSGEAHVVRKYE